jgi:hypothetical protein
VQQWGYLEPLRGSGAEFETGGSAKLSISDLDLGGSVSSSAWTSTCDQERRDWDDTRIKASHDQYALDKGATVILAHI